MESSLNDINDAKRRVEEMRKKAQDYVAEPKEPQKAKENDKNDNPMSFLSDITKSIFSSSNSDNSFGLILALILILSKEGGNNKLILALLYILM